jgi:hypothetical protein
MCRMAARYSDRYDEYVKVEGADGTQVFEGEALHWFEVFRDAVNEAYFEISRGRLTPQCRLEIEAGEGGMIDLCRLEPEVCSVCGVYRADGVGELEYVFASRTCLRVMGVQCGEKVVVEYHFLPQRLVDEQDEPIFPESLADPSIYISLAVARVWQSERKMSAAQYWLGEYYQKLRSVRTSMKPMRRRRLPRLLFR